jgi:hypothetical protein
VEPDDELVSETALALLLGGHPDMATATLKPTESDDGPSSATGSQASAVVELLRKVSGRVTGADDLLTRARGPSPPD